MECCPESISIPDRTKQTPLHRALLLCTNQNTLSPLVSAIIQNESFGGSMKKAVKALVNTPVPKSNNAGENGGDRVLNTHTHVKFDEFIFQFD